MYEKLSMFGHPAYFSMFLILSICFLYFVELKKAISKSKKILIVCVLIFLSVSNYLVFSRAGVILLFLVFLAMIVIRVFESKRKAIYVVILLGAGLMFSFFVATNARINDALKQVHGISEVSLSDSYSKSGRLVIWLNAWEVIDNHYLLGVGNGDVVDKMVVEYRKHSLDELAEKRINPHNQYLEIFLGSGIVGFVLLLMLLIVPIMRSFKEMDYLFLSFIGIVSFNLLFESVFNSQTGVFYFVFFYGLFAINCNRCVVEKTPHLL
jgi:O-antigen ligase